MAWFLSRFFGWSLGMLRRARGFVAAMFGLGAAIFLAADPRSVTSWLIAAALVAGACAFWRHVARMEQVAHAQTELVRRQRRPQGDPDDAGA